MIDATETDFEAMSDEEFLNQTNGQAGSPAPRETEEEEVVREDRSGGIFEDQLDAAADDADGGEDDGTDGEGEGEGDETDGEAPKTQENPAGGEDTEDGQDTKAGGDKPDAEGGEGKEGDDTPDASADAADDTPINYEEAYKQVMGTFKANGKDFTPASPEEAVRLMQMGANYTKKMQTLAPNLKLMRMLENRNLLDEDKLNYLIDLDGKNPEAIKKLLRESEIDPLDLDLTPSEEGYKPTNHKVSDAEMAFHNTIDTVSDTPTGAETISHVNQTWDAESKKEIYKDPQILELINHQRANGIYDTISAEIDRQRTLDMIPQNTRFIDAYKTVGDQLNAQGKLVPRNGSQPRPGETTETRETKRQALETRPAARKPASNGKQARAASSAPGTAPKPKPKPSSNGFELSDEEFLAAHNLKV